MTSVTWDDREYRKLVVRLRTPPMRLFLDNLRERWQEWRAQRRERRHGASVDIRTQLKKRGLP